MRQLAWWVSVDAVRQVKRELPHPVEAWSALVQMAAFRDNVGYRHGVVLAPLCSPVFGPLAENVQGKGFMPESKATELRFEVLLLAELVQQPAIAFTMDCHRTGLGTRRTNVGAEIVTAL